MMPPPLRQWCSKGKISVWLLAYSLGPDFSLKKMNELRPMTPAQLFTAIPEINDMPPVGMSWTSVYFLASNIREDHLGIPGVFCDQPLHRDDWRGGARCCLVG